MMETLTPPAIYDKDDLAKIVAGSPDRPVEEEIKAIHGGKVVHDATMAHELRNAVLVSGNLFTSKAQLSISNRRSPLFAPDLPHEHDEAALASSSYGIKYFGHWMRDDLTRQLAARDIAPPVSVLDKPTLNQQGYLDLLDLNITVRTDAFFKRVVVLHDVGQNAYKHARHLQLRQIASSVVGKSKVPGVMLLRGKSGERRVLLNEGEVAEYVRSRGFLVLDPAKASARELLTACNEVDVVIGIEGSQLSNGLMWMSRSGTFVVLQPPQRFVTVLKDHCDNLGMRYAFIVCDGREDGAFHLDLGALARMLDRVSS
jgi:capsular polysaccharide biosynthesis protein